MKKAPFSIIKLHSSPDYPIAPREGQEIPGYGVVTNVWSTVMEDSTYIVRINRKTVLINTYNGYCIIKAPIWLHKKTVYFTKLEEVPQVGSSYKMKRYTTLLGEWKSVEKVICGKFVKVEKLWDNLYYAESRDSAYYIAVE